MKLETLNAAARDLEATIASNVAEQTIPGNVAEILTLAILNETEIQVPPLPLQWRIAGIRFAFRGNSHRTTAFREALEKARDRFAQERGVTVAGQLDV